MKNLTQAQIEFLQEYLCKMPMKLSKIIENSIITMGLGPTQRLITYGYGDKIHAPAASKRSRASRKFDPKDFDDLVEHWEIKTNIFGLEVNYKDAIEYNDDQDIKIDVKENNIILDDIYKVEVKSIKRKEVLSETER